MLKLRRNINQTLQGAPPSCESPRILPLAPCVPPEDVPPTRIHRTARDGAHSVKPMAHPGAPLRGGCASPLCIGCNQHVAEAPRPWSEIVCRTKETCEPVFFSREREHNRRNNRCYGTVTARSEYTHLTRPHLGRHLIHDPNSERDSGPEHNLLAIGGVARPCRAIEKLLRAPNTRPVRSSLPT
jgi:hypothetical protein